MQTTRTWTKKINEEKKRLQNEFEKLNSEVKDETEILRQKLESYDEDMLKENILLKTIYELLSFDGRVEKTSWTELNLTAEVPFKKYKIKRKFNFPYF